MAIFAALALFVPSNGGAFSSHTRVCMGVHTSHYTHAPHHTHIPYSLQLSDAGSKKWRLALELRSVLSFSCLPRIYREY